MTPAGWTDGTLVFGFLNTELTPETIFTYRIAAINAVGTSSPGPSIALMSKAACPHHFYPKGDCGSFALCDLQDGQSQSATATLFCKDLTQVVFVSARFGKDSDSGSPGSDARVGDGSTAEASPIQSLSHLATLLDSTKTKVVLYPADDFNDPIKDCGAIIGGGKTAHFLGFNSTVEVDETITSGTRKKQSLVLYLHTQYV